MPEIRKKILFRLPSPVYVIDNVEKRLQGCKEKLKKMQKRKRNVAVNMTLS
jgi:hypothetical protein